MLDCGCSNLASRFLAAKTPDFWDAKILIQSKYQKIQLEVDVSSCWVLGQVVSPTEILHLFFQPMRCTAEPFLYSWEYLALLQVQMSGSLTQTPCCSFFPTLLLKYSRILHGNVEARTISQILSFKDHLTPQYPAPLPLLKPQNSFFILPFQLHPTI